MCYSISNPILCASSFNLKKYTFGTLNFGILNLSLFLMLKSLFLNKNSVCLAINCFYITSPRYENSIQVPMIRGETQRIKVNFRPGLSTGTGFGIEPSTQVIYRMTGFWFWLVKGKPKIRSIKSISIKTVCNQCHRNYHSFVLLVSNGEILVKIPA